MTRLTQTALRIKKFNRTLLAIGFASCISLSGSISAQTDATEADDSAEFAQWLVQFRADAIERGISAATLDEVIPTIERQRRVIQADRSQAEFVDTYANYLRRVNPNRVELGKKVLADQGVMIDEVSSEYAVQGRFVAAILGMESNYGTYPITEPMFNVLATLAFDSRRGDQFRNQLFAAFEIVDKGYASFDMMKSSWAGALGAPQFMPDSYLRLAVDHDQDGQRDLWTMGPDVIGSVANYLKATNWKDDQTWGRAVSLPPGGEQSLPEPQNAGKPPEATCRAYTTMGAWRSLLEWQELGVRREDGSDLPSRPLDAALIIGDEGDDQGYLVYRNFCSLLRYNPSFKYALGVSLLSDAIAGIEQ